MRCKACNRPINGSDGKNGDLCSYCRSLINKDLADDGFSDPVYNQSEISLTPVQIDVDGNSTSDTQNIDTRKYFYDFFDNF